LRHLATASADAARAKAASPARATMERRAAATSGEERFVGIGDLRRRPDTKIWFASHV
jgi:hypothetical protein